VIAAQQRRTKSFFEMSAQPIKPLAPPKLSDETAEKFRIVGIVGGPRFGFGRWGEVDFSTLTLARAEQLAANGFPHLQPKTEKGPKAIEIPKP
jgi:hypothetical protein